MECLSYEVWEYAFHHHLQSYQIQPSAFLLPKLHMEKIFVLYCQLNKKLYMYLLWFGFLKQLCAHCQQNKNFYLYLLLYLFLLNYFY